MIELSFASNDGYVRLFITLPPFLRNTQTYIFEISPNDFIIILLIIDQKREVNQLVNIALIRKILSSLKSKMYSKQIKLIYNIQMKYSITIEEDISNSPITIKSKFCKTFTHFTSTTMLQVTQDNVLRLRYLINQYGQEVQENKSMKNMKIQVKITEQIEWQRLRFVWPGQQQWILFLERPFRMYFVLKKYGKIVPILLAEPLELTQMNCFVNYPDAILYGHQQSTFTNHLYSINLTTFESKELTFSKNYNPGNRKDYWSYFSDNRLYIYGGIGKNGKQVEELFWTFNIENGNWFALDMPSNNKILSSYSMPCEVESGKVVILSQNQLLLVQLYQSRVSQIEGWKQCVIQKEINDLKGYFLFNGQIFFHDSQKIMPFKGRINKIKAQKSM